MISELRAHRELLEKEIGELSPSKETVFSAMAELCAKTEAIRVVTVIHNALVEAQAEVKK